MEHRSKRERETLFGSATSVGWLIVVGVVEWFVYHMLPRITEKGTAQAQDCHVALND
jgi:hypothetical protein